MEKLSDFGSIISLSILGLVFFIIKQYENELTEKTYITNTYLYILLALAIVALVVNMIDKLNLIDVYDSRIFWPVLFIGIGSLLATQMISVNNQFFKHIAWVVFIISMGVSLYPLHKKNQLTNQTTKVFLTLMLIVGGLTIIANYYPLGYFKSWGMPLVVILFGLVTFQLLDIIFSDEITPMRKKIYAWITIILFTGFIVYDTQKVMLNAKIMVEKCAGQDQLHCVDYPSESLGLFLDMMNMYTGVSNS